MMLRAYVLGRAHDIRADDKYGGPAEQCLSRSAARAGTAADRFQVSLSPVLGLARGLGMAPLTMGALRLQEAAYWHQVRIE